MKCARRTSIPDAACSIFRERALPASDWEKVLAWARFMQVMLNRQARLHAAQQQPAVAPIEEAALPAQPAPPADSPRKQKPIRYPSSVISVYFAMLLQAMGFRQGALIGSCCSRSCTCYLGSWYREIST